MILTPGHTALSLLTIRSSSWRTPLAGSSLATLNRAHNNYYYYSSNGHG
jgi:hypothetical protein